MPKVAQMKFHTYGLHTHSNFQLWKQDNWHAQFVDADTVTTKPTASNALVMFATGGNTTTLVVIMPGVICEFEEIFCAVHSAIT